MTLPESTFLTEEQYLELDRESDRLHEYMSGEVFAMSGLSREHNIIALNTSTSLNQQLRERQCEIYQSDMRVQIKSAMSIGTRMLLSYAVLQLCRDNPSMHAESNDTN